MALNPNKKANNNRDDYQFIFEHNIDGIVVIQNGLIKLCNPALGKLLGYSIENLAGSDFLNFVHPDDRDLVLNNYHKTTEGEQAPERILFRIMNANMETMWVESSS